MKDSDARRLLVKTMRILVTPVQNDDLTNPDISAYSHDGFDEDEICERVARATAYLMRSKAGDLVDRLRILGSAIWGAVVSDATSADGIDPFCSGGHILEIIMFASASLTNLAWDNGDQWDDLPLDIKEVRRIRKDFVMRQAHDGKLETHVLIVRLCDQILSMMKAERNKEKVRPC